MVKFCNYLWSDFYHLCVIVTFMGAYMVVGGSRYYHGIKTRFWFAFLYYWYYKYMDNILFSKFASGY